MALTVLSRFLINLKVSAVCTVQQYPNVIKINEGKLRPAQDKMVHKLTDKNCRRNTNTWKWSRVDDICTYLKPARFVKCKAELISRVDLCESVWNQTYCFLQFFSAIFWRKKRHIEYILVVCSRFFVMFDLADRKDILETTTILSEYRDGRKPRF